MHKLFKKIVCYSGAALWNSLPCKARCAESLRSFKCTISSAIRHGIHGQQLLNIV